MAVVTVTMFLVILGLPTLVRASQKTKTATCQSNLRQLGFALQAYSDANGGFLPGPVSVLAAPGYNLSSSNELVWFIADRLGCPLPSSRWNLAPQLVCPAREPVAQKTLPLKRGADYALNDGRGLAALPFGRLGATPTAPARLASIAAESAPSSSVAISDADKGNVNPTLPGWAALSYQPVHGKLRNQLYFDWHVGDKRW